MDYIPTDGKVMGEEEHAAARRVVDRDDMRWLTYGEECQAVEREFADAFLGDELSGVLCNSGSSACLIAACAMRERFKHVINPIVVTTALAFPTTMSSLLYAGFRVVVVDSDLDTLNFNPEQLKRAVDSADGSFVGLALAHTLGNPFDLDFLAHLETDVLKGRGMFLFADCCDALGARWNGRHVASLADVSTFSFYPAHHISCEEGGMVLTRSRDIRTAALSLRDWGRDCVCLPGQDNVCGHRFDHAVGGVLWDHKYIYSRQGFNLTPLEIQGALLRVQLRKWPAFKAVRERNCAQYRAALANGPAAEFYLAPLVKRHAEPSWMDWPLIIRQDAGFEADQLARALESRGIGTRRLLGGDLTRQPGFANDPRIMAPYPLDGTMEIMRRVVRVGCWPGLGEAEIARVLDAAVDAAKELSK